MPDDFCPEHGYEFMVHPKVWGSIPYCGRCDDEAEALRRFPWCYPPESDKEDARRAAAGKEPRDWGPTREQALKQARAKATT